MTRARAYNRALYIMMRELSIVRSQTLDTVFKDVFVRPHIKERMDAAKKLKVANSRNYYRGNK